MRGRGNGASVLRIVPYAALHFGAYEYYRELLANAAAASLGKRMEDFTVPPALDLVAGSAAGATAVLVRTSLRPSMPINASYFSAKPALHVLHSLCGSSVAGESGRLSSRKTADSGSSSGPCFPAGSRLQGAAQAFCFGLAESRTCCCVRRQGGPKPVSSLSLKISLSFMFGAPP